MRRLCATVAVLVCLAVPASAAAALPDCPGATPPVLRHSGLGLLEAAISDAQGRLFVSASDQNAILRFDTPTSAPTVLAPVADPGGLAWAPDGSLIAGEGNGFQNGVPGNLRPAARLLRIDPETGVTSEYAAGLQMANGVAAGPDGSVYASNDVGTHIDRVAPDGTVDNRFARVVSANGLVVSPDGRWLFAAQTFQPAAVQRVDLADPAKVDTHFQAPVDDIAAGPDAMAGADDGTLYVAAQAAADVWRIAPDRSACVVARDFTRPVGPSAVAPGRGATAGSLFTVTFAGEVLESRLP